VSTVIPLSRPSSQNSGSPSLCSRSATSSTRPRLHPRADARGYRRRRQDPPCHRHHGSADSHGHQGRERSGAAVPGSAATEVPSCRIVRSRGVAPSRPGESDRHAPRCPAIRSRPRTAITPPEMSGAPRSRRVAVPACHRTTCARGRGPSGCWQRGAEVPRGRRIAVPRGAPTP
jgi:hypothetical protein